MTMKAVIKSLITGVEVDTWPVVHQVPRVGEYIRTSEGIHTYRLQAVVKVVWISPGEVEVFVP